AAAATAAEVEVELHVLPAGRRAEVVARVEAAAHLIVAAALLGVLQDLVRLVHLLEALLGVLRLVAVRVVLLRERPVGLLDLVLARVARDTEGLVVVPELHRRPHTSERG